MDDLDCPHGPQMLGCPHMTEEEGDMEAGPWGDAVQQVEMRKNHFLPRASQGVGLPSTSLLAF